MSRRVLAAAGVVLADTVLLVGGHAGDLPWWVFPCYVVVTGLVVALRYRSPAAAFVAALLLSSLTGTSYVLLLWAAFQAGRGIATRTGTAVVAGAALGFLGARLAAAGAAGATGRPVLPLLAATYVVFVVLPMLAGRYLAQHDRLVAALNQRNRQLRWQQESLAERERLRERLRIASDMHDSLGHRLSLVSVQAAALEVAVLPAEQAAAVGQLAASARAALDELYELVGLLRRAEPVAGPGQGLESVGTVVAEFQAAGVPVTLDRQGLPLPLPPAAGRAAYRVVEEGLTNAAKHAPGQPVTVRLCWEPDALLLTVTNPAGGAGGQPADHPAGAGQGLAGLAERAGAAGGFCDHRLSEGEFRLLAMLPAGAAEPAGSGDEEVRVPGSARTVALGFAVAVLMFAVLPVGMLVGVR